MKTSNYRGEDVIITGGTRGIGREIALALYEKGYGIHAIYKERKEEALTLELMSVAGIPLKTYQCNITSDKEIGSFFKELGESQEKVVCLINNAGTFHAEETFENSVKTFMTNVIAPIMFTARFAEYRKNKGFKDISSVINIGSTSGYRGPSGGIAYASSKAALHRATAMQAKKYAPEGIHINTLVCGPIKTELLMQSSVYSPELEKQTPTGRLTTPKEVASLVVFLVENRDLNIIGSEIVLDGGRIL